MKAKSILLLAALAITSGCSPTDPDQADFVLAGSWRGPLISISPSFNLGDMQITLEGQTDGATEKYRGEGTLFGVNQPFRFQQLEADYDTATAAIEMVIFDFPTALNRFVGTFDGTTIMVADTLLCQCQAALTQTQPQ